MAQYRCIRMSLMVLLFGMAIPMAQDNQALTTVSSVDLSRYVGRWHEIAKIPNRFQKKCVGDTTAEYSLRPDGQIDVLNSCRVADGTIDTARGVAKIVDRQTNARLKVSFVQFLGMRLFWGDYWILGLGDNYEYAVIGTPGRKYGWILSRTPQMSQENLEKARQILRQQGYRVESFQ